MSEEKCFCHLNGYKVKDADARAEIETLKAEIEALKNAGSCECAKEAYIDIDDALSWHNSAGNFFCLHTPYYNNTIVGGSVWDASYGHFTLQNSAKLEFGKDLILTFAYGPGLYTYTIKNLSVTEINGVYYWSSQDISITDASGTTVNFNGSVNGHICSLLVKSSEV